MSARVCPISHAVVLLWLALGGVAASSCTNGSQPAGQQADARGAATGGVASGGGTTSTGGATGSGGLTGSGGTTATGGGGLGGAIASGRGGSGAGADTPVATGGVTGTGGSGGTSDAAAGGAGGARDDASIVDVQSSGDSPAEERRDGPSAVEAADAGDSSGSFNPCPALPAPCKIMASGDSITVGAQSTDTGGYRVPLFRTTLGAKQTITFVGPSGAGPATVDGVAFPDAHDGHSGYLIDTVGTRKGIAPLMAGNLTKLAPHIVLLMIGTNDVNSQTDLPNAPARLASLVDLITDTAPQALLVVAQLIPTRTDSLNEDVKAFNAAIPAMVKARAKAGKHVVLVDMYGAFTANASYKTDWLFDGLHPSDAGYAIMAKVWHAAIGGLLR